MKVFVVFAHPEPRSLTGSLLRVTVDELEAQGHEVRVSDLYAMKWKPQLDRDDFPQHPAEEPLSLTTASAAAAASDSHTEDVKREQEKLLWADAIILQFPLWWYSMPAILKGWVDRVFTSGFGYGLGEYNEKRWGDRYGEGRLEGKRAMLIVTVGAPSQQYSARGIAGPIEDILFPITHGILFYTGVDVLPSFVYWMAYRSNDEAFQAAADELRQRLRDLPVTEPIPYRHQNAGDYEIPSLLLKPGLENSSDSGFSLHRRTVNG
ncbi:Putative Flavoprotein-like superfamily [Colletotrichum destructivum]|uniref:Flavoprotein-like superfamily n=1 Tax=Colletotrichum destructivum TaxID=34406 RepID=A0AAX4IGR1_9PEZI|nr:Putative Flavoprotein-like superfamily [Colletotrichum destructivum]